MRFLTAYFAIQPHREVVLTGSERMQERPIKLLVEALNGLGADISYEKEPGFPPLIITACAVDTKDREGRITSLFFISKRFLI